MQMFAPRSTPLIGTTEHAFGPAFFFLALAYLFPRRALDLVRVYTRGHSGWEKSLGGVTIRVSSILCVPNPGPTIETTLTAPFHDNEH